MLSRPRNGMDLKLLLCLLVVSVVLVGHLNAMTTVASVASSSVSVASAAPVRTTLKSGSTITATKPTTKVPVLCYTGKCTGPEACENATVIASYTPATCSSGICVTKIQNSKLYEFSCASKDCADEKVKAKGSEVRCCKQAKCNTYEAVKQSSSTRLRSDSIAVCAWLVLFLVKLF